MADRACGLERRDISWLRGRGRFYDNSSHGGVLRSNAQLFYGRFNFGNWKINERAEILFGGIFAARKIFAMAVCRNRRSRAHDRRSQRPGGALYVGQRPDHGENGVRRGMASAG